MAVSQNELMKEVRQRVNGADGVTIIRIAHSDGDILGIQSQTRRLNGIDAVMAMVGEGVLAAGVRADSAETVADADRPAPKKRGRKAKAA